MDAYDAIVVGLGAMGSSAAYHLARRGPRILGLEQFDIPHWRGSSHGYSRMIRLAYYEHPDYVPLLRRSYELWHELERSSGQKLLHLTGGLYMGPPTGHVVAGALAAARRHGLEHELLSRQQIAARFPHFQLPASFAGVLEPQAGFLLPERTIAAHAEGALRAGAELHGHEAVTAWQSSSDGVAVTTARGTYRAKKLIFCGGAWSTKLVADLGVKLTVTRQVLGWLWPRNPEPFALGRHPVWGIEQADGSLAYGFPMMSDNPGLKMARHAPGTPADPDTIAREPVAGDEQEVTGIAQRYLPDGLGPVLALRICMYTNSPDGHFILDRHPRHENVLLACGFSGHGFKFASVIGEVLADLAMDGRTNMPVQFLGMSRFLTSARSMP
jgi:sarcosine oxidase